MGQSEKTVLNPQPHSTQRKHFGNLFLAAAVSTAILRDQGSGLSLKLLPYSVTYLGSMIYLCLSLRSLSNDDKVFGPQEQRGPDFLVLVCGAAFGLQAALVLVSGGLSLGFSWVVPILAALRASEWVSFYWLATSQLEHIFFVAQLAGYFAIAIITQNAIRNIAGLFASLTLGLVAVSNTFRVRKWVHISVYAISLMLLLPSLHMTNEVHTSSPLHPIEQLWLDGHRIFNARLESQSRSPLEAVTEYRRRYQQEPPPGFEKWVEIALRKKFQMIDEFDGMMRRLKLFKNVPPNLIMKLGDALIAKNGSNTVPFYIGANGEIDWDKKKPFSGYMPSVRDRLKADPEYLKMLSNLTIVFNTFDEPGVVVPYDVQQILANFDRKQHVDLDAFPTKAHTFQISVGGEYAWVMTTSSCPPDSPAKNPWKVLPRKRGNSLHFVSDLASERDPCLHPEYADLHGFFNSPVNCYLAQRPLPLWSWGAPRSFSDLLFPSPYYSDMLKKNWYHEEADVDWDKKNTSAYWAGATTGARSKVDNWRQVPRTRLVLHTMPGHEPHNVTLLNETSPGKWDEYTAVSSSLQRLFNTKLSGIYACVDDACDILVKHFGFKNKDDFRTDDPDESYKYKYVIDIDGNGFSGRFHRLIRTKSAVLKLALFQEWHDEFLVPWVHFIPLSVEMGELYEMMRFLTSTEKGDIIGQSIAEAGSHWAKLVLREEDLELVTVRLFLEYQRMIKGW